MGALAVLLEAIARLAAVILGGWLAYTEATGTYEFYLEQAGGVVTFLVRATVGITIATVILPYFMSRALKERRLMRALNIFAAFMLCVGVILTAGVSRTGSAQDAAKAAIKEQKRKLDLAAANVKTAEQALATDNDLVKGECKTGVGKECKRLAGDTKGRVDTTIKLREKAAEVKEAVEDNTDRRLSALTLGVLNPEQVETIRPLLMPVTLSFVAGLLITLGLDMEHPSAPRHPERQPRRWPWSRREEEEIEPQTTSSPEPAPEPSQVIDAEIAEGDPGTFLATSLKPGESVREDDVCLAYEVWCAAHGCTPIPRAKFKAAFVMLCQHSGFRRARGKVYGMQLSGPKRAPRLGKMAPVRQAGESR